MVGMSSLADKLIMTNYYKISCSSIFDDSLFLHFHIIPESGSTCVDIALYKRFPDYGWSFGHCLSSLEWLGRGTYIEKCCVTDTNIALTCSAASKDGDWKILVEIGYQSSSPWAN